MTNHVVDVLHRCQRIVDMVPAYIDIRVFLEAFKVRDTLDVFMYEAL